MRGFIAYPSAPREIGVEIKSAAQTLKSAHGQPDFHTWEENDIAGRFLVEPILENIAKAECLVADITKLNFNVSFEIGYAIGLKRRILLVCHSAVERDVSLFPELGIFDTIGYLEYSNGTQLAASIAKINDKTPLPLPTRHLGSAPRLFLLEPKAKTHYDISLSSSLKKSLIGFERYDPVEKGRLPAGYAIEAVSRQDAFVASLLPRSRTDHLIHNNRVAFCAGIANALGRDFLLLQESPEPVALDYREFARLVPNPNDISGFVGELALKLYASRDSEVAVKPIGELSLLERVNLGSSIAENESRGLDNYYLETEQYKQAIRGEVQAVIGRKGSGKSAFFLQMRNHLRRNAQNVVLDLQPEGFQLLKFKERCLALLSAGSKEHLLTAFWEYVLLLEIAIRILRDDRAKHVNNHLLNGPYQQLSLLLSGKGDIDQGDFSERLERILDEVAAGVLLKVDTQKTDNALSNPMVTELLHKFDLRALRELVESYVQHKAGVWILIDNLDKGWPATGLTEDDARLIRCLQSALMKIEKPLKKHEVTCKGVVFLRSDVYRKLIDNTPDKGKVQSVSLDLTNREVLREILRRRIAYSLGDDEIVLEEIWPKLFVSHIGKTAEETCSFLIDRAMMRPRCLLDLVKACRSNAITFHRSRVEQIDIKEGLNGYSVELASNIGFEIRDVYGNAPDIIYELLGQQRRLTKSELSRICNTKGVDASHIEEFIELLLISGVVGLVDRNNEAKYIFDQQYELRKLKAVQSHLQDGSEPMLEINPAFWTALEVDTI